MAAAGVEAMPGTGDGSREEERDSPGQEEDSVLFSAKQNHSPTEIIPVPPTVPVSGLSIQAHKLWVGHLDKRLTEQNILKFMLRYGEIVSFKYLLHTSGLEKGEPRGYCFVEYSTREEAERAKCQLNGKVALGKKLVVDWARPDLYGKKPGSSVSETWDASTVTVTLNSGTSTAAKIAALEAKLKQMDRESSSNGSVAVHTGGERTKKPYYHHERVRRKHGNNITIQHPGRHSHCSEDLQRKAYT